MTIDGHDLKPDGKQRRSVVPLAICGAVGALLGGPGAVFVGMLLANLYVVIWDPRPASSYGYQDPFSGLGTFLLIGCIVFVIGAGLGAFAGVTAARRWSRRRTPLPPPGSGWRRP